MLRQKEVELKIRRRTYHIFRTLLTWWAVVCLFCLTVLLIASEHVQPQEAITRTIKLFAASLVLNIVIILYCTIMYDRVTKKLKKLLRKQK